MDIAILNIIGAVVAAGGLFFTALTYRKGQIWQRAELARQLVERLSTDDELAFCTRALDWGVGPLVIPEKHRPLFPEGTLVMEHDVSLLRESVQIGLGPKWRTPEALTYRHSFDAFFTYLLRVADQVRCGHVSMSQLVGLDYYLKLVAHPAYLTRPDGRGPPTPIDGEIVFRPFVEHYYKRLDRLIWAPDSNTQLESQSGPAAIPAR